MEFKLKMEMDKKQVELLKALKIDPVEMADISFRTFTALLSINADYAAAVETGFSPEIIEQHINNFNQLLGGLKIFQDIMNNKKTTQEP